LGLVRPRVRRVLVGDRVIALCEEHFKLLHLADVQSVEQVRALFMENVGMRSLVSRRAPLDRRAFPPRPEGRRRDVGRRRTDRTT
jgi:hypothetical protein